MANLPIVPDNVLPSPYASRGLVVTYGADVAQGMPLYANGADAGNAWPAVATSAAASDVIGIASVAGGRGQNGYAIPADPDFGIGATITGGVVYCVSATTGGICPSSDLVSGNFITILGTTNPVGNLNLSIITGREL